MQKAIEKNLIINEQTIATKCWENKQGIPTIAAHGWLDNAATFDNLAPLLPNLNIVAIDLPGHGYSSHKPPGTVLHIIDFVIDIVSVLKKLQWDNFIFLGHSLGGALGSLLAGALPSKCKALISLDALGPMTTPAEISPQQFALFLNENEKLPNKKKRYYDSYEQALKSRLKVNKMLVSSCEALLNRGLQNIDDAWCWRTDPRLMLPSALQLSEEHVLAFLKQITCPSMIVRPNPGFPFPEQTIIQRTKVVRNLEIERIEGHHHVHLDNPEIVATLINRFLEKNKVA
jgi:pimeloyl-ACP methyl ester carboxylesterase